MSKKCPKICTIAARVYYISLHKKRGDLNFQFDFNVLNAVMLRNDVIFQMKKVSDMIKDQRSLFQFVLFFSLISHIELNEQHYNGKKAYWYLE